MDAAVHPDVAGLAFLIGTWVGGGHGGYPTIEPFDFSEEIVVEHGGDAWLGLRQRSWAPDGSTLHWERGFLRPGETAEALELTLAHPLGLVEVAHGTRDGTSFATRTEPGGVGRTATGLDVVGVQRRYVVDGDELRYELDMQTERTPMTWHLASTLRRRA
jgi:hypothetical protein